MRKVLKWIGFVLGGLVGLLVLAAVVVFVVATLKLSRTYDIEVETVTIPDDQASLERGEHLVTEVAACVACHGDNLEGKVFIDDPAFMLLHAPNLTAGAEFSDEDFVRAIRHGVDPDGKPLIIMPAQHLYFLSDDDLGAILAYLKSVPPVDNEVPEPKIGPVGYVFVLVESTTLPANTIDHTGPRPAAPDEGVTPAYGEYLVEIGTCADCHGEELNGAPGFGDDPPAANLTPGGELAGWSEEDFAQTLRTGVNPAGRELLPPMSEAAEVYGHTDDELAAIFAYLQSLPALETGY